MVQLFIVFIVFMLTLLVAIVISTLQYRKQILSKRVFLYVAVPLILFPGLISITYIAWPATSLNLGIRLLIALGVEIIVLLYLYLFTFRYLRSAFPEFREFFKEDEQL